MSNQFMQLLEVSICDFIYSELHSNLTDTSYYLCKNNTEIVFVDDSGIMVISVKNFLNNYYSCFR